MPAVPENIAGESPSDDIASGEALISVISAAEVRDSPAQVAERLAFLA
jgi:hypothetical protein